MRKLLYGLTAVSLLTLILRAPGWTSASEAPIPTEVHAGTVEDPWLIFNSPTVKVAFDNTYTATQLVQVDCVVFDGEGTKVAEFSRQGRELFPRTEARFTLLLRPEVEALPNNAVYRLSVRVWDENGNSSGWAELWARKYWVVLEPPGGCAVLR